MANWLARWLGEDVAQTELLTVLIRGAGVALIAQLLGVGISYTTQILLARWMGVTAYGTYDYVIAIATFLGFLAGLGLPNALLRFIPEYTVKQDWGRLKGVIIGSWQYVALSSLLVAVIGSTRVSWLAQISSLSVTNVWLGLWTIPLLALARHQLEMTRGSKQIALAYLPSTVCLPFLIVLGSIYYDKELTSSVALAITIASLSLVLLVQLWCFRGWLVQKCQGSKSIYVPKEWFAVALPLLLNDGAQVILSQTDIVMIGSMLGSFEVGIYTAAIKTARWVSFILAAVNAIAAPMFATLYTEGKLEDLEKLVANVARWLFFPALIVAISLIFSADLVLGLFGEEFTVGRWEMTILSCGQLVNVGAGSVGYLMQMTGHHRECALVFCCSAALNSILNFLLIPTSGILGAAIATTLTMVLWNIWLHQLVVSKIGVRPSIISAFRLGK
jgi:O-antigen/teichoic acid export membrane protein